MKIFSALLLAVILTLTACSGGEEEPRPRRGEAPSVTVPEDEPEPVDVIVGEASTELLDKDETRVDNIDLACGAVNGYVIEPGESFSFNGVVGRRSEEKGYGDATVIISGHKEQGCGGGVCQVSSTLYMAALNAGLQIDERHPHSHGVPYAPDGNDATVSYGQKDLAFTNNTDGALTISAWTDGDNVFSTITRKST